MTRFFSLADSWDSPPIARLGIDASLWGFGVLILLRGGIAAWFVAHISDLDLQRFKTSRGDLAYQSVWEALGLLIEIRTWQHLWGHRRVQAEVSSDSVATLAIHFKLDSPSPNMRMIAEELTLEDAMGAVLNCRASLAELVRFAVASGSCATARQSQSSQPSRATSGWLGLAPSERPGRPFSPRGALPRLQVLEPLLTWLS